MAMHDATSLASELLNKLSELEQKVESHRQDMACEFQRYSRNLLQNVPNDLSARVEKTIKDSMHQYPALQPALNLDNPFRNESPRKTHMDNDNGHSNTTTATDTHSPPQDKKSTKPSPPPPLLPHKTPAPSSSDNDNTPRSPHEREREFQGLFTPSYLPLLDGRENDNNRLPPAPAPSLPATLLPSPNQSNELTNVSAKDEKTAVGLTVAITRPDPVRNPTEETISSVASDDSSSKQHRRSALRRSSSSSAKAPSPRRVRFEVEGGEVLPTASPLMSPRVIEHMQSPLSNTTNILSSSYDSDAPESVDDGASLLGSSPPQPRKTSSTDKLKAMARNSSEDTSQWSLVGNLQDMDADEETLVMGSRKGTKTTPGATSTSTGGTGRPNVERISGTVEHVETVEADPNGSEAYDEEEDDDLLEMPALTSFKTKKRFSPPQASISEPDSKKSQDQATITKASQNNMRKSQGVSIKPQSVESKQTKSQSNTSMQSATLVEDDELFDWEEDEDAPVDQRSKQGSAQKTSKYLPDVEDEDVDEAVENEPEVDTTTLLSTSPAIPIAKPAPAATSPPSRHFKEAVGSYNGKPFTISSVKDHSILEKAAKMGNVYSFVGSVDGRSGVDESTSYRPEVVPFNGTPRSFSQRLMMEEFEESRRRSPRNGANE
ncbi:hypothetical protein PFICI_07989 [Pestalotiopsis fici W106-1]|uniref:Uncharacterized protein n=1 Tax=Pestalotiopsis fici (strain W106-1 / CGMCC3.15140) TaxID=1229662 RepID=W3X306_PESFW|nr:uncharacterized protein PFICI_07989 [Pestalotiopsis fici W106-1]ETS80460.1 hypothetical protein PFICI_07989 [Pestalotiopsis fici W106-1]